VEVVVADVVAVVGGEGDDGVCREAGLFEFVEEAAEVAVDGVDGGVIAAGPLLDLLGGVAADVGDGGVEVLVRGGINGGDRGVGDVGLAEVEADGERLVLVLAEELDRLVGEDVGETPLDDVLAVGEVEGGVDRVVAAAEEAVELVEAEAGGVELGLGAEVPLAEEGGGVPGLLEDLGPGGDGSGEALAAVGLGGVEPVGDADLGGLEAGEDGGPAGGADGGGDEGVGEHRAFSGEAVLVDGLGFLVAVDADGPGGLVVGDDLDEVHPRGRLRMNGGREEQR
jgi:hypothetical protein